MHPYLVKAIMDEHIRDLSADMGTRRLWKIRAR
jgi:hypothetical protein